MQKRKFDHITPKLRDNLYWLLASQKITYKLRTIVLSISVCINLLRSTFGNCASLSRTLRVVVICAHLFAVICKSLQLELKHTYDPRSFAVVWFSLRKRFVTVQAVRSRYI